MRNTTLATLLLLFLNNAAKADVAPEPYDPTNPTFWIVIGIVIAVAAYFYLRRKS